MGVKNEILTDVVAKLETALVALRDGDSRETINILESATKLLTCDGIELDHMPAAIACLGDIFRAAVFLMSDKQVLAYWKIGGCRDRLLGLIKRARQEKSADLADQEAV